MVNHIVKMYSLAIFVALVAIAQAESPAKEETMAIIKQCRETTGWTGNFQSEEITKERKCFHDCVMKKFGVLTADGKLNKEKALERGEKFVEMHGKPGDIQKFKDAVEQCYKDVVPSSEQCEAAFQYNQCFKQKGLKP